MRRFELIEGSSSKFWEIEQAGSELHIRWGRIGTAGQSQTKSFDDGTKATTALTKLVSEKTGKGYKEVGVAADASIGKTEARPKAEAPATAAAADPATAVAETAARPAPEPVAAAATADPAPSAPAESLDRQCERAVEAVRAAIEAGTLKPGDKLSAAVLKRQHDVSEQGAAMAFEQLKSTGLLYGWGSTAEVREHAQDTARQLAARAAVMAPFMAVASGAAAAPATPVSDGTPPWLAQGEPVRLTAQTHQEAYASRRYPFELPALDKAQTWTRACQGLEIALDLSATDAALRPAAERMLARDTPAVPPPDA
ncbi:MAG TPA: WGR domain-containing protein, partial [Burkholderiaceae bacterium]|nr:WGR domain-containing protein [Burkholderiaceae bacterium]